MGDLIRGKFKKYEHCIRIYTRTDIYIYICVCVCMWMYMLIAATLSPRRPSPSMAGLLKGVIFDSIRYMSAAEFTPLPLWILRPEIVPAMSHANPFVWV